MQGLVHLVDIRLATHFLGHIQDHGIPADELVLAFCGLLKLRRHRVFVLLESYDVNQVDAPEDD